MELEYQRKNYYRTMSEAERLAAFTYAEGYKEFLDAAKTEREAVAYGVRAACAAGFTPYEIGQKIEVGSKIYLNNRSKSLYLLRAGSKKRLTEEGLRILVAHVDSPRLDLKQVPLYESGELAYFKTHYYGGIKKYQWLTIPLALHGVVVRTDGTKLEFSIGEAPDDPVFYITDLLPHLSQEQYKKTIAEGFGAENLNLLVGGIPAKGEEKEGVKKAILELLYARYGMVEEDFLSAELEAVPAAKARDVGFDCSMIASYGHDDRVCAYPEMSATFDASTDRTVLTVLADKEEIGSEGNTGMQCRLIDDIIDAVAVSYEMNPAALRAKSKCLSADVTSAYDPTYRSAFEKRNVAYLNHGVAMNKFTGARGKSGSNDASAEYVAYLRSLFARNKIIWQTGELGRVDLGGGGTVAMYLANRNIDTVDLGVPVLSMHAPYELVSKADLFSAYRAFKTFIEG